MYTVYFLIRMPLIIKTQTMYFNKWYAMYYVPGNRDEMVLVVMEILQRCKYLQNKD